MSIRQHHASHGAQNPGYLLDAVMRKYRLRNDAALCRFLKLSAPQISKIRHRRLAVSSAMLLLLHEKTDISIQELRALLHHVPD